MMDLKTEAEEAGGTICRGQINFVLCLEKVYFHGLDPMQLCNDQMNNEASTTQKMPALH